MLYIFFCRLFVCNVGMLYFEEEEKILLLNVIFSNLCMGCCPGEFLLNYHKCWVTYVGVVYSVYAEQCGCACLGSLLYA